MRAPVVKAGNATVDLAWNLPHNGGEPITGIEIQSYRESPDSKSDLSLSAAATVTRTISGLDNGFEYGFRIRAKNALGVRDWSPWSTGVPTATDIALTVSPASIVEGTTTTVTATLEQSRITGNATVIALKLGGTGVLGTDYTVTGGAPDSLSIPANQASATATLEVVAVDDTVAEAGKTIVVQGWAPGPPSLRVLPAVIDLTDDDTAPAKVLLAANPAIIPEEGGEQTVTVTATLDGRSTFAEATTVTLSLAGDAQRDGEDYTVDGGIPAVTIPAGQARGTMTLTLTPVDDRIAEGGETMVVQGAFDSRSAADGAADDGAAASLTVVPTSVTLTDKGIAAGGTLADATVYVGGPAHTVTAAELLAAFNATNYAYTATSSDADVATAAIVGDTPSVTALSEGQTTVTVTAYRNGIVEGTKTFLATAIIHPAEEALVQDLLSEIARNTLAGVTGTIRERFAPGERTSHVTLAGVRVPLTGNSAADASDRPTIGGNGAAVGFAGTDPRGQGGTVTAERLAGDDTFSFALGAASSNQSSQAADSVWSMWGRGDFRSFEGEPEEGSDYEGSLRTAYLGFDVRADGWIAGLALAQGRGTGEYSFDGETPGFGTMKMTLTSLHPYAQLTLDNRTEVWGTFGVGTGDAALERSHNGESVASETSGLGMQTASFGARWTLDPTVSADLAVIADAGFLRLQTEEDGPEAVDGLKAEVWRARLGLEGSRAIRRDDGSSMTPFGEIAVLQDGGDGATGAGVEVAGGIRFAGANDRLQFSAQARILALHTASSHREWGLGASLSYAPGADGDGWSAALTSNMGAAAGGVGTLGEDGVFSGGPAAESSANDMSLRARAGYGFSLVSLQGVLTPYGELAMSESGDRSLEVGAEFGGRVVSVEFAGTRIDNGPSGPEHRIGLDLRVRFHSAKPTSVRSGLGALPTSGTPITAHPVPTVREPAAPTAAVVPTVAAAIPDAEIPVPAAPTVPSAPVETQVVQLGAFSTEAAAIGEAARQSANSRACSATGRWRSKQACWTTAGRFGGSWYRTPSASRPIGSAPRSRRPGETAMSVAARLAAARPRRHAAVAGWAG